jgi:hypothetical protein
VVGGSYLIVGSWKAGCWVVYLGVYLVLVDVYCAERIYFEVNTR